MQPGEPVVFCYAPQDAELAHQAGGYLERNLPLQAFYEEGLIQPGYDLLDATARALSAEWAIVLLSPDSLPVAMERERWEPVFLEQPRESGSNIVFVLARECRFPALLRRQPFADFTPGVLPGLREIKRLIVKQRAAVRDTYELPQLEGPIESPAIERLRAAVADGPGSLEGVDRDAALRFAHASKEEFEGAFWIDCSFRTPAGILGDTSHSLGLTLSGSLEQNAAALRDFCTRRRCLFIYEHLHVADRTLIEFGGLSSILVTAESPERPLLSLDRISQLFARWHQCPAPCLELLGDAHRHVLQGASSLGVPALALLKHYDRLAEANEFLDLLISQAAAKLDQEAATRLKWDRSWIVGHWGEPHGSVVDPARPPRDTLQLGFDFS